MPKNENSWFAVRSDMQSVHAGAVQTHIFNLEVAVENQRKMVEEGFQKAHELSKKSMPGAHGGIFFTCLEKQQFWEIWECAGAHTARPRGRPGSPPISKIPIIPIT